MVKYILAGEGNCSLHAAEPITLIRIGLVNQYPIISIEDGMMSLTGKVGALNINPW